MADPYMTIPVSEFENLHEDNRLLRERIAQLEGAIEQTWRPEVKALAARIKTLEAEIVTWGHIWNDQGLLEARAEALRDGTAHTGPRT